MDTMKPTFTVHQGRRYRLKFHNASDDIHPLHLHRHGFELTRIAGKPTLFHCHQHLHMDFGFMALLQYA